MALINLTNTYSIIYVHNKLRNTREIFYISKFYTIYTNFIIYIYVKLETQILNFLSFESISKTFSSNLYKKKIKPMQFR
jgi:hypothetical protein